ncbi:hypothetical protein [Olsenella urininfantis]|uniref:hypothetical protein n=1 Tax=Olsenella urininfantis TaxID=1871033 RepID=UPI0009866B5D|nr:hypothetical protein [Olsenella urininfantis]
MDLVDVDRTWALKHGLDYGTHEEIEKRRGCGIVNFPKSAPMAYLWSEPLRHELELIAWKNGPAWCGCVNYIGPEYACASAEAPTLKELVTQLLDEVVYPSLAEYILTPTDT